MQVVILGLSLTSSWGNGHATTYRALARQLNARGHSVTFLERDVPWYAQNRDMPTPTFATTHLYDSLEELRAVHQRIVVQGAIEVLVEDQLKHFDLEDLRQLRELLDAEIAARS